MPKRSIIPRPTEDQGLARWQRGGCQTKPISFPHIEDKVERHKLLRRFGGCVAVSYPILFENPYEDMELVIPEEGGIVTRTCQNLEMIYEFIEKLRQRKVIFSVYMI